MCLASEPDRKPDIVQAIWPRVWSGIREGQDRPSMGDAVTALVSDGMIGTRDDGSLYDIPGWVVTSVRAGVNPYHARIIDSAFTAYWLEDLPSLEDAHRGEEARARAVSALLSAAPYLARGRRWDDLRACLDVLLSLDHSPVMIRRVLDYWQLVADATGSHEDLAALERMLTGTGPAETERLLRSTLDNAGATGDLLQSFRAGFDLAGLLLRQGRAREAFGINDRLPALGIQSRVGRWSMIAVDIQRLMVLHDLGEDVVDRVKDLCERVDEMRAADGAVDEDEPISPDAAREVLLHLGVRAATAQSRWGQALAFSNDLLEGMRERGATAYEIAEAQHNRYIPLFNLGDLDAAEMIMLYCREVYEVHGHPGDLAKTYGALGEIAWARGQGQQAIDFQKETLRHIYRHPDLPTIAPAHKHFAQYLGEGPDDARLAHSLLAVIVYRLCGEEERSRSLIHEIADRQHGPELLEAVSPEWLASVVGRVDGVDVTVLERVGVDPETIAAGLAGIISVLRHNEAADAAWNDTLRRRWEPAIAAVVSAVSGDRDAATALSEHLDVRELAPEWSRLVNALRLVLDGERDLPALTAGLDATDAAIVANVLDALAGRYRPRATLEDLAAVTHDARRRHREFLKKAVAAARGDLLARDDLREWTELITREDASQQGLTTAVLAAVEGTREPDPRFGELMPAQIRLVRALIDAIDADEPGAGKDYAASNQLYAGLSDPIGPSNADVRTVLTGDGDLDQAITATEQGVKRRLDAGDIAIPIMILELILPELVSRYEFRHALPMAELFVVIQAQDPSAPIRADLAKLVCLTAIEVAE